MTLDEAIAHIESVIGSTYGPCIRWRSGNFEGARWYLADAHLWQPHNLGGLISVSGNGNTPEEAIFNFLENMQKAEMIVVDLDGRTKTQTNWRWNGAQFVQVEGD